MRICDIKKHEYFSEEEICHEFIQGDLKKIDVVKKVILSPYQKINSVPVDFESYNQKIVGEPFDEVYQLAADMGGAGFIFTGENDADIMHNSVTINLNVLENCKKKNILYLDLANSYKNSINKLSKNNLLKFNIILKVGNIDKNNFLFSIKSILKKH